jgi:hypothetical protein
MSVFPAAGTAAHPPDTADASPFDPNDAAHHLPSLYRIATDLEMSLANAPGRASGVALTPAQIGSFNHLLASARALLPNSVALREDVDEVDENTRLLDAHHHLHTTIVPTLHNALPDPVYDKTG